MEFVRTCISLGKEQRDFVKNSPYCLSKLVQCEINKLMKESIGPDLRPSPIDESLGKENSNG